MRFLVLIALTACLDSDPLPACADLGCPNAPSGDSSIWTPCDSDECFCVVDSEPVACVFDHGRSNSTLQ